jgi:hypothetical protein
MANVECVLQPGSNESDAAGERSRGIFERMHGRREWFK